ncbi:MAG: hypothetical protein V4463_09610 [Pseudomonadota bacterium]
MKACQKRGFDDNRNVEFTQVFLRLRQRRYKMQAPFFFAETS